MDKRWIIPDVDRDLVDTLSRELRMSTVTAQLLVGRGIEDAQSGQRFLSPSLHELRDPCDDPIMAEAADHVRAAVETGRRITIYGDYDADGICATAVLVRTLRHLGGDVDFHIPQRQSDGYGLSNGALESLREQGTELVITVDCGIAAHAAADHAGALGMELIVTDHHALKDGDLPDARFLLNPRIPDRHFGYEELAGVGVAFKLAWALGQRCAGSSTVAESFRECLMEALPLVAIGTVADLAPLTDENRVLVYYGLRMLGTSRSPGVQALLRTARLKSPTISARHVGYQVAPRLNAVGRMADARAAVEMLTTDDAALADDLAEHHEQQNRLRQSVQRSTLDEAMKRAAAEVEPSRAGCIVLSSPDWHQGVVGLVAARLAEAYGRPAFVLREENGEACGSGRSVSGFHLFRAVSECADLLVRYGGHEGAAGLTISTDAVPEFRERMTALVEESVGEGAVVPPLHLDGQIELPELSTYLVDDIRRLAPFGAGNPVPAFCAQGLKLAGNPQLVGSRRDHLAFLCRQGDVSLRVIAFGKGDWLPDLRARRDESFALAFQPSINEYRGSATLELRALGIMWQSEGCIQSLPPTRASLRRR